MRSSEEVSQALAAQLQRTALLNHHARALAHEISNLMFLSEIRARQAPEPPAGEEIRRSLPLARRLARLLADTLTTEPKRRVVSIGDAFEEIESLLVAPGKGQLPSCDLSTNGDATLAARFQETPAALLLIVQEFLRQAAAESTETLASASTRRLVIKARLDVAHIVIDAATHEGRLTPAGFAKSEGERNGFALLAFPDGSLQILIPWLRDDSLG